MTESDVQATVRLELAKRGYRLWRNNVGVLTDERGVPVRYGLANESKALNERLKSSDLIGWRSVVITPDMVGRKVALFVTMETKVSDWRPALSGKKYEHEQAQQRWIDLVVAEGGEGRFITGV